MPGALGTSRETRNRHLDFCRSERDYVMWIKLVCPRELVPVARVRGAVQMLAGKSQGDQKQPI